MKSRRVVRLTLATGLALSVFSQDLSVKRTQELLKSEGYYSGKVDGVAGPQTKSALETYQRAQNLPISGTIDSKTAGRLQSGAAKEAASAAPAGGKQSPMPIDSSVKGATSSEAKSAAGEMKSVPGGKKKTEKK